MKNLKERKVCIVEIMEAPGQKQIKRCFNTPPVVLSS